MSATNVRPASEFANPCVQSFWTSGRRVGITDKKFEECGHPARQRTARYAEIILKTLHPIILHDIRSDTR